MSLVTIQKELANIIEDVKKKYAEDGMGYQIYAVLGRLSDAKVIDVWGLTFTDVARAVEEGYEIKREYLTLEQVFELPNETTLKHGDAVSQFVVTYDTIRYNNNRTPLNLAKWTLSPKWYVVD